MKQGNAMKTMKTQKLALFLTLCVVGTQLPLPLQAKKSVSAWAGVQSLGAQAWQTFTQSTLPYIGSSMEAHPYTTIGIGAGIAAGIYFNKPITSNTKRAYTWSKRQVIKPWTWTQRQFNRQHWFVRAAVAAPTSMLLSALICRYAALIPMPGTVWDTTSLNERRKLAYNTLFGTLSFIIFQKMSGTLQELRGTISGETSEQNSGEMGEFIEPDESKKELDAEDLDLMCSEDGLKAFIFDLKEGKTKNLLLKGTSNTGKTTFARDLANALDRPLFILNASKNLFQGQYFGDLQKKFEHLRQHIESMNLDRGSIVCLDEVDQFIKEFGDAQHQNLQLVTNKSLMDLQDSLSRQGIILIMLTNVTDDSLIKDQIRNRILRVIKDDNGEIVCDGGYIVLKENPNIVARGAICKRTVEDALTSSNSATTPIFEDVKSFCYHIAKYTDGCNNGEVVAVVKQILEDLRTESPLSSNILVSLKNEECLGKINTTLLSQLNMVIKNRDEELQAATANKTTSEKIKVEIRNSVIDLKNLKSNLVLYSYKQTLKQIFKLPQEQKIQNLTLLKTDLATALHPYANDLINTGTELITKQYDEQQKESELQIAQTNFENGITQGNQNFATSFGARRTNFIKATLAEHLLAGNSISKNNCTAIDNALKSIESRARRVNRDAGELNKILEVKVLWNKCKIANDAFTDAHNIVQSLTTEINRMQQQETTLAQTYPQAAADLIAIQNGNGAALIAGLQNPGGSYKELCSILTDVKQIYETHKTILPSPVTDAKLVEIAEKLYSENYLTAGPDQRYHAILVKLGSRSVPSFSSEVYRHAANSLIWLLPEHKKRKPLLLHKSYAAELSGFNPSLAEMTAINLISKVKTKANLHPGEISQFIDDEIVRTTLCGGKENGWSKIGGANPSIVKGKRNARGQLMAQIGNQKPVLLSTYAELHKNVIAPLYHHVDI